MSRMSELHADLVEKADQYSACAKDRWSHQWGLLTASSAVLDLAEKSAYDEDVVDTLLFAHQCIMTMYHSLKEVDRQDV